MPSRRFRMIISAWWLRTSSKFKRQEFEEIYRNIGSLETPNQVQIHPSAKYSECNEKCAHAKQKERLREQRVSTHLLIYSLFFKLSYGFGLDFELGLELTLGLELRLEFGLGLQSGVRARNTIVLFLRNVIAASASQIFQ